MPLKEEEKMMMMWRRIYRLCQPLFIGNKLLWTAYFTPHWYLYDIHMDMYVFSIYLGHRWWGMKEESASCGNLLKPVTGYAAVKRVQVISADKPIHRSHSIIRLSGTFVRCTTLYRCRVKRSAPFPLSLTTQQPAPSRLLAEGNHNTRSRDDVWSKVQVKWFFQIQFTDSEESRASDESN